MDVRNVSPFPAWVPVLIFQIWYNCVALKWRTTRRFLLSLMTMKNPNNLEIAETDPVYCSVSKELLKFFKQLLGIFVSNFLAFFEQNHICLDLVVTRTPRLPGFCPRSPEKRKQ